MCLLSLAISTLFAGPARNPDRGDRTMNTAKKIDGDPDESKIVALPVRARAMGGAMPSMRTPGQRRQSAANG